MKRLTEDFPHVAKASAIFVLLLLLHWMLGCNESPTSVVEEIRNQSGRAPDRGDAPGLPLPAEPYFNDIGWKPATPPPYEVAEIPASVGAEIDESLVAVEVQAVSHPGEGELSLAEAWQQAVNFLAKGQPVRLRVAPGVYRVSDPLLLPHDPTTRETLLVIEGTGGERPIFTGCETFQPGVWTSHGNQLFSTPWPHRFGNATVPWGAGQVIAHRREMLFVDRQPLQQVLLERYKWTKAGNFSGKVPPHQYLGFDPPEQVLGPNTFGVTEREENGQRLFIRLSEGMTPEGVAIEVATRGRAFHFGPKTNLVLRNLVFTGFANGLERVGPMFDGPVLFDPETENLLIENCAWVHNNGMALHLRGTRVTVRQSQFNYNGYSGVQTNFLNDAEFFETESNFNNWRGHSGGAVGWFTGGMKFHQTTNQVSRRHVSIGNLAPGFWYDIDCRNIYNEDIVTIFNHLGVFWELSQGPFEGNRILSAFGRHHFHATFRASLVGRMQLRNSILINANPDANLATLAWYTRKDDHAKLADVRPDLHELINSLLVSLDVPARALIANTIRFFEDPQRTRTFAYAGRNNTFADPDPSTAFLRTDALHQFEDLDLTQWIAKSGPETESGFADVTLRDPLRGDFRFASGTSSPFTNLSLLPDYRLPARAWDAAREFFVRHNWSIPQQLDGFPHRPGSVRVDDE